MSNNIVIYFNWDAFGKKHLEMAMSKNMCPTIEKIMSNGVYYDNAFTHIPSITNAIQPCIVSGTTPKYTDNHYRYFNKETLKVQQETPARLCRAELLSESLKRQGVNVLSINQFTMENRGTTFDDENNLYIEDSTKNGIKRFNLLYDYINSKENINELYPFIAFYADDIDSLSHNNREVNGIPIARDVEEKNAQINNTIKNFDNELARLMKLCDDKGFIKNMTFILTADHGMTSYGPNSLEDSIVETSITQLEEVLQSMGLKVETLYPNEIVKEDTQCVIVGVGIQAQVSFLNKTDAEIDELNKVLIDKLQNEDFYGEHRTYKSVIESGSKRGFADIVISPKPNYFFKSKKEILAGAAQGQHDSLDDSSQRVPIIIWGKSVEKGKVISRKVHNSSVASTVSNLLNKVSPIDSNVECLWDALTLSKPNYQVFTNDNTKVIKLDSNSNRIDFNYVSNKDHILKFEVNSFKYDLFFPNTNGVHESKVVNYELKESDIINLTVIRDESFRLDSYSIYVD